MLLLVLESIPSATMHDGGLPAPQRRGPGGAIQWAVGLPEWPRSQSWRLFGSKREDDVYLGPRWQAGAIKLSLHRSGQSRTAWTEEYARSIGLPDDVDRVLGRWEPPKDVRPGWQHAVTVLVTRESMAQHTTPERRSGKVAFFPPPDEEGSLWFRVLLGRAGGTELAIRGAAEVGGLELPGGGVVAVIVRPDPLTGRTARVVADLRAHMLAAVTAAGARRNTGFSWGRMDDGAVVLIDPGPIEPEGSAAAAGGRSGKLTHVRRADQFPADSAGHQRDHDGHRATPQQLSPSETDNVRTNVMWVAAQVLGHADPNFDIFEFAEWCGVETRTSSGRPRSGHITAGLRRNYETGSVDRPGDPTVWDEEPAPTPAPDGASVDRRPDQVGTAEQRARPWPADPNTRGFVTARSRNVHRTTECVKYVHTVNMARQLGRTAAPARLDDDGRSAGQRQGHLLALLDVLTEDRPASAPSGRCSEGYRHGAG